MDDTSSDYVTPERPSRTKQIVAGVLTVAVIVLVFVGIFPQFADYGQAWSAVQQISAAGVFALLLATVVNLLVYVTPFQAAVPGLSFRRAFVVRQTSFMISNVVPAGGAIGLGTQYAMLSSYNVAGPLATAVIGITALWNVLVTLGLPVLAILVSLLTGDVTGTALAIAVTGVVAIGVVVAILALVFRSDTLARTVGEVAERLARFGLRLIRRDRELGLPDTVSRFRASTVDVIGKRWVSITATNVLMQLGQFAVLYVALVTLQAAGAAEVTLAEALLAFAFARLASFIPITPGGLGTVDTAMTALLVNSGAASEVAVAAVLIWRALSLFPQVIVGVITFLVWRKRAMRAPSFAVESARP